MCACIVHGNNIRGCRYNILSVCFACTHVCCQTGRLITTPDLAQIHHSGFIRPLTEVWVQSTHTRMYYMCYMHVYTCMSVCWRSTFELTCLITGPSQYQAAIYTCTLCTNYSGGTSLIGTPLGQIKVSWLMTGYNDAKGVFQMCPVIKMSSFQSVLIKEFHCTCSIHIYTENVLPPHRELYSCYRRLDKQTVAFSFAPTPEDLVTMHSRSSTTKCPITMR